MAASSKKVMLFIVEGPTDEDALSPILKKLFQTAQVRFHVVHGDISTDLSVDSSNAVSTVNDHIKMEMDRYGFKRSDIIRVIHLIDTDGAFIPNANVVTRAVEKLQYEENQIATKSVPQTIARNERKQRVLHRLYPAMKVSGNLTDDQKVDCADQFADTYSDDPENFIKFMSDSDFTVRGDYGETWRFIFDGTNSLHRHCNVHLLFADLQE